MILQNKYTEVQGQLGEKTINSTISQNKLSKLWDMLQNPYKNNIGSIVRELSSNMIDSHTEAGIEDAIRIKFSKDESNFYVSFIDVGIGMSPDRVEKVYSTYLESTKELSNDFIGAFGIGSKSPLSYQDVFYINTRFNSVEYNYMMRKGAEGPAIDLLNSEATTERNGTEIKIYIKNESDLLKFLNETFTQLHYFKNVVIDINDLIKIYNNTYYTNQYTVAIQSLEQSYNLIEGKHFVARTNTTFKDLHIAIGEVYYPIDWSNLQIPRINIPIALKFNIGELEIIQTREDIRYTEKSIKAINDKIESLKQELIQIYNLNSTVAKNVFEFFTMSLKEIRIKLSDTFSIYINRNENFIDLEDLNAIQIKGFPYSFKTRKENIEFQHFLNDVIDEKDQLFAETINGGLKLLKTFNSNEAIKSVTPNDTRFSAARALNYWANHTKTINSGDFLKNLNLLYSTLVNISENLHIVHTKTQNYSVRKNKYLAKEYNFDLLKTFIVTKPDIKIGKTFLSKTYEFFNKFDSLKQISFKEYVSIVKCIVKPYEEVLNDIFSVDYDKIEVSKEWWDKNTVKTIFQKSDYDRTLLNFERYSNGWIRKDIKFNLEEFNKTNKGKLVILLSKDQQTKMCSNNNDLDTPLEKFVEYLNFQPKIKSKVVLYATANKNYEKVLKHRTPNIFTIEEFLKSKKMQQRILGKIATYLKIQDTIKEFNATSVNYSFNELGNILFIANQNLYNEYIELSKVLESYKESYRNLRFETKDLMKLLEEFDDLDVAHCVYDKEILSKFNNILDFINTSKINTVACNYSSLAYFIMTYKPAKLKHALHNDLLKTNLSLEDIQNKLGIVLENVDEKDVLNETVFKTLNTRKITSDLKLPSYYQTSYNKWYIFSETEIKKSINQLLLIIYKLKNQNYKLDNVTLTN
jgi:hypothetical protein